MFGRLTEPIRPTDTSGDLLGRLAEAGAALLVATLDGIEDETIRAEPQPAEGVSFAPKLTPADARVDWKLPAHLIDRAIRACTPDPGAWTEFDTARIRIFPVTTPAPARSRLAPGELHVSRGAAVGRLAPRCWGRPAPGQAPHAGCDGPRARVHAGTGSRPVLLGDVQPPAQAPHACGRLGARLAGSRGQPSS